MRLATWNCCRAARGKTAEATAMLGGSVTVLQEARKPAEVAPGDIWLGPNPRNGLAALTGLGYDVRLVDPHPGSPWSIVPLELAGPTQLRILMVWTRREHKYMQGLDAALTLYSDFLLEGPSVVLGDFNANAIWKQPRMPADFSRVAARLESQFGMVSAYHKWFGESYGEETRPTHYFWRQRERPFHIDYCFVPSSAVLQNVAVRDEEPWASLSDHRPLVVDFSL